MSTLILYFFVIYMGTAIVAWLYTIIVQCTVCFLFNDVICNYVTWGGIALICVGGVWLMIDLIIDLIKKPNSDFNKASSPAFSTSKPATSLRNKSDGMNIASSVNEIDLMDEKQFVNFIYNSYTVKHDKYKKFLKKGDVHLGQQTDVFEYSCEKYNVVCSYIDSVGIECIDIYNKKNKQLISSKQIDLNDFDDYGYDNYDD